jgi:hypothetical protein
MVAPDGFHKAVSTTHGPNDSSNLEFFHPCVHRGQPALLSHVKRTASTKKVVAGPVLSGNGWPGSHSFFLHTMQSLQLSKVEVDGVMQQLQTLQDGHATAQTKIERLHTDNQALLSEVQRLRLVTQEQQWKINRVRVLSPHSLSPRQT